MIRYGKCVSSSLCFDVSINLEIGMIYKYIGSIITINNWLAKHLSDVNRLPSDTKNKNKTIYNIINNIQKDKSNINKTKPCHSIRSIITLSAKKTTSKCVFVCCAIILCNST